MFLCLVSMTSAMLEDCEIESPEIISATKICTCISSQYKAMTGELEMMKKKLSDSEKEVVLATNKLKVSSDDFVTFNCEVNDESPKLCGIQNLKVDKEKMRVIKVLVPESSYMDVEDLTELEILNSNIKFIPQNIFDIMPALEAFTIIRSSLTSITRGSFKGADNIESITIEGNIISDLGPYIFEGAEKVLHLLLSQNNITTVSPEAFHGLKSLKVLSLRGNKIKNINVNVFKHNISLRKLTFSHNFVEEINSDLLKNNPELIYLKFDHNWLSGNDVHTNLTQYAKKGLISDFSSQQEIGTDEEVDENDDINFRTNV